MSLPVTEIRCTHCDFKGTLLHRPVAFSYQFPDGELLPTSRDSGWCHHCKKICSMESVIDVAAIEQEVATLTEKIGSFNYVVREYLGHWFGGRFEERQTLATLKLQLKLAGMRKSARRCLDCGKEGATPLWEGRAGPFVHQCGGQFFRLPHNPGGARFSFRAEVVHLDIEGNRLFSDFDRFNTVPESRPIPAFLLAKNPGNRGADVERNA